MSEKPVTLQTTRARRQAQKALRRIVVPVLRDDKHHMTGKPTELMRRLVRCVPPDSLVLDPFAGSGTTLVAAELEGRRAIGFDLEHENVRVANERLEAARNSIDARAALQKQSPLFPGAK